MTIMLVNAKTDLGLTIDGANLGPSILSNHFKDNKKIEKIIDIEKDNIKKSKDKKDLKKNLNELNIFNNKLYNQIKEENKLFPITIGGDHSISIATSLASIKKHKNMGIIWIDAHLDYNTFDTTITGNLHGLPLATINGLNEELSSFHKGNYYNPKNTVVVGYRSEEENKEIELNNIKEMGVTVFTTKDIKELGIETVIKKAVDMASNNTNGIHISYDLDLIDPETAPGVSVPEENGINKEEALSIIDEVLKYKEKIKSFDLVEFNPTNDIDKKTELIAKNILEKVIKNT